MDKPAIMVHISEERYKEICKFALIGCRHTRIEFMKLAERYEGTPWASDPAYLAQETEFTHAERVKDFIQLVHKEDNHG